MIGTRSVPVVGALLLAGAVAFLAWPDRGGERPASVDVVASAGERAAAADGGRPLTEPQRRGRAIYRTGTSRAGGRITASIGGSKTRIPAVSLLCANCHGYDGRGKPEGGIFPTNITWADLTKPYRVESDRGRERPPYDEQLLRRSIVMGVDSGGTKLDAAMPVYQMSHEDLADLVAYLRVLGTDLDLGVTAASVRIGAVLPPVTRFPDMHQAIRATLAAFADRINEEGGVYNRRLEVSFLELAEADGSIAAAIGRYVEEERIFALTSVFMAGGEADVAAVAAEQAIPVVGAFTLYPETGFPLNRHVFYLDAGLRGQCGALAKYSLDELADPAAPRAVVHRDVPHLHDLAEDVVEHWRRLGVSDVVTVALDPQRLDAADVVGALATRKTQIVLALGLGASQAALLAEAERQGWTPWLLVPGSLAGPDVFDAPASFDGRIFLAFPTLPQANDPRALRDYAELAAAYGLPAQHRSSQLLTLAAARILVEGMRRAGAELSRQKLVESLEGLYEFPTGYAPPATFGPNRRIAAVGAYVVSIDPETRELAPVGDWIDLSGTRSGR